jgi:hypothetical protein
VYFDVGWGEKELGKNSSFGPRSADYVNRQQKFAGDLYSELTTIYAVVVEQVNGVTMNLDQFISLVHVILCDSPYISLSEAS